MFGEKHLLKHCAIEKIRMRSNNSKFESCIYRDLSDYGKENKFVNCEKAEKSILQISIKDHLTLKQVLKTIYDFNVVNIEG